MEDDDDAGNDGGNGDDTSNTKNPSKYSSSESLLQTWSNKQICFLVPLLFLMSIWSI
eukprot:CAMPEP_0171012856 /NCGR_PEP_ID=MMETSP0736-20130129/23933_1 /TAXON_ID=186038 /ORGANISM="Fragilariopsis kerguelensis, Strain L26-C5" /LENGTH=56 /DNA_ID=CAMNT_0011446275 /DNA_START=138 /DNA_END=308 /DNA_ORIENTATION=+